MTKAELSALRKLRRTLTMENAGFGTFEVATLNGEKKSVDSIVKEQSKLWRESWVYPILDDIISKHEARLEGKEMPKGWSSVTEDYSYFTKR